MSDGKRARFKVSVRRLRLTVKSNGPQAIALKSILALCFFLEPSLRAFAIASVKRKAIEVIRLRLRLNR